MSCSSFHGKISEIPGICVDNFERPDEIRARAYFLSHCHTDHTRGLHTPELLNTLVQTNAYIYTSEQTAAVIRDECPDQRIIKYIKTLKMGTTLVTLPSVPEQKLSELYVDVTLIPASHSFGSVMFLFRTKIKTILFTGDFRISSNDVSKYCQFYKSNGDPITIDTMYVDTTFVDERYQNFPKRSVSIEYAVEEIKKWLEKDENNRVALHTSAKFGYESVFKKIYDTLGMKVCVSEDRWQFYRNLSGKTFGVTNDKYSTKIHICRNRTEKYSHSKCLTEENNNSKYLYVHLSAMKWDNYEMDDFTFHRLSEYRLDVCFPTHCSRSELLYFVNYFSPKKIVGFPNEFPKRDLKRDVEFKKLKLTPIKRKINLKNDNIRCKVGKEVDRKLLNEMFDL